MRFLITIMTAVSKHVQLQYNKKYCLIKSKSVNKLTVIFPRPWDQCPCLVISVVEESSGELLSELGLRLELNQRAAFQHLNLSLCCDQASCLFAVPTLSIDLCCHLRPLLQQGIIFDFQSLQLSQSAGCLAGFQTFRLAHLDFKLLGLPLAARSRGMVPRPAPKLPNYLSTAMSLSNLAHHTVKLRCEKPQLCSTHAHIM